MGRTVIHGKFEWDADKAAANVKKHGISFEEILPMFDDPLFMERLDAEHSTEEEIRYIGIAKTDGFIVVSIYTERERTSIISARIATKKEEQEYEENCKQFYS